MADATPIHKIDTDEIDESFDNLLSVDEVAALLGMSRSWVRAHARSRVPTLPSLKFGYRTVRFRRSEVLAFVSSLERSSAPTQNQRPAVRANAGGPNCLERLFNENNTTS